MRSKPQCGINAKLIVIFCFFLLLFTILILRSNLTPPLKTPSSTTVSETHLSNSSTDQTQVPIAKCPSPEVPFIPTCTKTPPSLANALIHYATTNITPQQTFKEISVSAKILAKKAPCNFLVFGLGLDSLMWAALNHGGRTVFLEEDQSWIDQIKQRLPNLESYHVVYDTKVHEAEKLFEHGVKQECQTVSDPRFSKCQLALKNLPGDVYDMEWDLIMVDAPTGYFDEAPGRMSAIYTAGLMGRNREEGETDVFVHDVDRVVEDKFSKAFLCEGYFREQEGRIRHFTIPSHRTRLGRPFCP